MSKCSLSIELERPDFTYRPGELVRGRIEVTALEDCTCDGLSIELMWRTHGRGNRAKGDPNLQSLGKAQWKADETRSYPFELTLPAGPVTYHGNLINVDWYLDARADIPWALDPKAEREILLVPGPAEGEMRSAGGYRDPARPGIARYDVGGPKRTGWQGRAGVGTRVFFGLLFGGIGGVAFYQSHSVFTLVFVLVGLGIAGGALLRPVAESRIGVPEVEIDPNELRAGERATVRLILAPVSRAHINGVSMEVRGQEIAVSGSGTNRTTHRHDLFRAPSKLDGPTGAVEAGARAQFQGTLALPPDAAPSFRATDNEVRWSVTIRVDIEGWPDWQDEYVFTVVPSAGTP